MHEIKIGSGVTFDGPGGALINGIVIRRNRKTVTVYSEDDRQWNVSPQLLKPGENYLGSLVEREMPFLKLSDEDYKAWITANVLAFVKK